MAVLLAIGAALGGCGDEDDDGGPLPSAPSNKITLTSPSFENNGTLPQQFTCDGQNVSPPLRWSGVPDGAGALALLLEDPDAPGEPFLHWSLFDMGSAIDHLDVDTNPPDRAHTGENSFASAGYRGPCPPTGDPPHRYVFALYALTGPTDLDQGASPEEVRDAIARTAVARGVLIGKYGR